MKLNKISIKNYKSIKDLTLNIKEINGSFLRTLLGINESGKSNILKAVFEMSNNSTINYEKDCQKDARRNGEMIIISFIYELNTAEIKNLSDVLSKSQIVPKDQTTRVKLMERRLTLTSNSQKIYEWLPVISEGVKFIKKNENEKDSEEIALLQNEASFEELKNAIKKSEAESFFEKSKPQITYWKAEPQYLIKNPINLDTFKQNKNSNIPLKNLFSLVGISEKNLDTLIDRVKKDDAERRQVSKEISEKSTKYINEVWPEHKIRFEIWIESNSNCLVHIMDKDSIELFQMDERSDGFKQFVSILLTLSADVRNNIIKDNIILIDEPEINLHPSSIQYLRDELLKISKDNHIIIASHSIFIVDKKNLERHIKVFKEQGETKIDEISQDNPFAEEVIYRSLGTSIYEIIEPYIMIFEGSTDKDIYDAFVSKFKEENVSKLKTISATGVKEIRKYLKFFNQKTVTAIVLVDSDKDGNDVLKTIKEHDKEFEKSSFSIKDVIDLDKPDASLEDLLPGDLIKEIFFKIYDTELSELKENESFVKQIKEFKESKGLTGDHDLKEFKDQLIKRVLSDMNLSFDEIKKKYHLYFKFFKKLNEEIRGVQTIAR